MFFVIGFGQWNVAWLCILEAATETCSVKRSDVIFCKKLGTKEKETPNLRTLRKNRLFHKNNFQTRLFNLIPVGLFDICQRFQRERGV